MFRFRRGGLVWVAALVVGCLCCSIACRGGPARKGAAASLKSWKGDVLGIALAEGGRKVVTVSRLGDDKGAELRVWDAVGAGLDKVFTLGMGQGKVWRLSLSGDGRAVGLISLGAKNVIHGLKIYDTKTGRPAWLPPGAEKVHQVAVSHDASRVAVADSVGRVTVWDTAKKKLLLTFAGRPRVAFGLAFSPDGRYLVGCGGHPPQEPLGCPVAGQRL